MTNRRFITLMLSIPVVFGILVGGCADAANATENTILVQSPDPAFGQCRAVELTQAARKGESVLVCETVKVRKPGRTTVEHIGR